MADKMRISGKNHPVKKPSVIKFNSPNIAYKNHPQRKLIPMQHPDLNSYAMNKSDDMNVQGISKNVT